MSNPVDEALMAKEAVGMGRFLQGVGQSLRGGGNLFGSSAQRVGQQFGSSILEGIGGSGADLGKGLVVGAAGAAGAAGIAGIGAAVKSLHTAATKRRDFREMMDLNPDLSEAQGQNPKFFNASYNSLRRLNPAFGKDPVVSGSVMRRMMENPAGAGTILTGTLKEPEVPRGSSELSVGGKLGPLEYRHRF
jgi:hypothetical protein